MPKSTETLTPTKRSAGRTTTKASSQTRAKTRTKKQSNDGTKILSESSPDRLQWIAEAAYYRALNRGFEPGHEDLDWLEAEQDYDKRHFLQ